MQPIIMWEGLDTLSLEQLTLTQSGSLTVASGLVIGVDENKPFRVSYSVEYGSRGEIRQVVCDGVRQFSFVHAGDGHWQDEYGQQLDAYDGCTAIDIIQTPFTNTIAIKQLQLKPGESGELELIYLNLAEGSHTRDRQRYTCLEKIASGSQYRFEQLTTGFTAILPFDENDFVLDYPELFRRVYPKASSST